MMVIKKDLRLQEFNEGKINVSIENASKDVRNMPLNSSDVKILAEDVIKNIKDIRKGNGNTSSYEIIGIIVEVLEKRGFEAIIKEFIEFNN